MRLPPLVLRPARRRVAKLLVVGLLMTALGVVMAVSSEGLVDHVVGAVSAAFFGLGSLVFVVSLISPRHPTLVLDDDGLRLSGLASSVVVSWSAVERVRVTRMFGNHMVSVSLVDPAVLDAQRGRIGRVVGRRFRSFGDVTIPGATFALSCEEIVDEIRKRWPVP